MALDGNTTSEDVVDSNVIAVPFENADTLTPAKASSGPLGVAKFACNVWSTIRQRDPPCASKTQHIRLITIAVSHYCEKVRWCLDMLEAETFNPYYYTEDGHTPGLHAYEPLKSSNGMASITPMVVFCDSDEDDDGRKESKEATVLIESSKILQRFRPQLYPKAIAEEVLATEKELGRRLGPAIRCFFYYHLLHDPQYHSAAVKLCADPNKVTKIEATFFEAFLPRGLADGIQKSLGIHAKTAAASLKEIRSVFAQISSTLEASGGDYLLDDPRSGMTYGFTAADLTLAALAYPLVRPPEMAHFLSKLETNPPEINGLSEELSQTKAGKHILKVYKQHRTIDNETGLAVMKNIDRNRTFLEWLLGY